MKLKNLIGILACMTTLSSYAVISTPVSLGANLVSPLRLAADTTTAMASITTAETSFAMSEIILTATGEIGKVVKITTPSTIALTSGVNSVTIPVNFDGGTVTVSGTDVVSSQVIGSNGNAQTKLKIATVAPIAPLVAGTYVGTATVAAIYE